MNAQLLPGFLQACEALDIPPPPTAFKQGLDCDDPKTQGYYLPMNGSIIIYLGAYGEMCRSSLTLFASAVNRTMLHELRHAYQHAHWGTEAFSDKPGAYWATRHEEDARAWAEENVHRFKTVRITRPAARSKFSKLGEAQRRVRAAS